MSISGFFDKFNIDASSNVSSCTKFENRKGPKNFSFGEGWEGIPFNLVLNSIIFTFMIILFACLRKKAWNRKSRKLTRTQKGWLQFIYGDRENKVKPAHCEMHNEHHNHDLKKMSPTLPPESCENETDSPGGINFKVPSNIEVKPASPENNIDNGITQNTNHSVDVEENNSEMVESNTDNIIIENLPSNNSPSSDTLPTHFSRSQPQYNRSVSAEFGYWLMDILLIKDSDILIRKGSDAVQYLVFQRYIIVFLTLLTAVCMLVILPINLQGNLESNRKPFARTTISNLDPNSSLLWVHVVISMLILPIGIFMMCHFSKTIKNEDEQVARRTLLISGLPKDKRTKEIVLSFFQMNFPDVPIEGIQFVYNSRDLTSLYLQYTAVVNAKYYCQEHLAENSERFRVRPYYLGILGCVICCKTVDGLDFYTEKEAELEQDLEKKFRKSISHPSGSLFVTFKTEKIAQRIYRELRQKHEKNCNFCPCFDCCFIIGSWFLRKFDCLETDEYQVRRWSVNYAPYPEDINWNDSAVDYRMLWFRRFIVHILLFILFFFLSTPSIFISTLNYIKLEDTLMTGLSHFGPLATEYLSPLLLVIASVILPVFVYLACQFLPYKTISDLNHSIMWKVFLFLIMMVIILPSLGLTSAKALVERIASQNTTFRWECLFPVDNGAFFVNYVLQTTLLGNAMELLRFPELFLYFFYLIFFSRSIAEYEGARQQIIFDFQFGIRYPRYLLIFCMSVTYSLSCPLIVPCGLLYMLVKHLVDRYNIYYVYTPSKINGRIHSTAIMFFHIGIIMMLMQMFTVSYLRSKESNNTDVTNLSMITLIFATIFFCGHCFFHSFWNINHLTYMATSKRPSKRNQKREFCACSYLPEVLGKINVNGITPPYSSNSNSVVRNYGTVGSPQNNSIPNNSSSQKLDGRTSNA